MQWSVYDSDPRHQHGGPMSVPSWLVIKRVIQSCPDSKVPSVFYFSVPHPVESMCDSRMQWSVYDSDPRHQHGRPMSLPSWLIIKQDQNSKVTLFSILVSPALSNLCASAGCSDLCTTVLQNDNMAARCLCRAGLALNNLIFFVVSPTLSNLCASAGCSDLCTTIKPNANMVARCLCRDFLQNSKVTLFSILVSPTRSNAVICVRQSHRTPS